MKIIHNPSTVKKSHLVISLHIYDSTEQFANVIVFSYQVVNLFLCY